MPEVHIDSSDGSGPRTISFHLEADAEIGRVGAALSKAYKGLRPRQRRDLMDGSLQGCGSSWSTPRSRS